MSVAAQLAGALLLPVGPLLLARAWRHGRERRIARIGGWTALAGALIAFGAEYGAARGIALALASLPLIALTVIVLRRDRRPSKRGSIAREARLSARPGRLRAAARALLALPLAGTASIVMAGAISRVWNTMPAGVLGALALTVLFWSVAMLWVVSDSRLYRPATALTLVALAGGCWLALT